MANCDNLITNQDLENAKQNADTYKVVIESDLPTTTTPDGKTIFTLTGLSQQISFIYPPILWEPGLTVDNALQLYEVPPSASGDTGSFLVFPFVENLPFVTGPTYDPSKWTVLQYSKENLDQAVEDAEAQAQAAAQSASEAAQSVIDASIEADRAQSEADRAEQAAIDATLNSGVYETVADGIAATSDGDLFNVISQFDYGFVDLYLNDSGVGVYQDKTSAIAESGLDKNARIYDIRNRVRFVENEIQEPLYAPDLSPRPLLDYSVVNNDLVIPGTGASNFPSVFWLGHVRKASKNTEIILRQTIDGTYTGGSNAGPGPMIYFGDSFLIGYLYSYVGAIYGFNGNRGNPGNIYGQTSIDPSAAFDNGDDVELRIVLRDDGTGFAIAKKISTGYELRLDLTESNLSTFQEGNIWVAYNRDTPVTITHFEVNELEIIPEDFNQEDVLDDISSLNDRVTLLEQGAGEKTIPFPFPAGFETYQDLGFELRRGLVTKSFYTTFDKTNYIIPASNTIYVDPVTGDDSNDGSQANPLATFAQAVTNANSSGSATTINLASGEYSYLNTGIIPQFTVDANIICDDSQNRAEITTSSPETGWAQDIVDTNLWFVTLSGPEPIHCYDFGVLDEYLSPSGMVERAKTDANNIPGSYYLAGDTIYVHLYDGRTPDNQLRVIRDRPMIDFNNRLFYMENVITRGGNFRGVVAPNQQLGTCCAVNCTFSHSINQCFRWIRNAGSRVITFQCEAAWAKEDDGFSYTSAGSGTDMIEIENFGHHNGIEEGATHNGSTCHTATRGIRINCEYKYNNNKNVADVSVSTQTLNLNVFAGPSIDDVSGRAGHFAVGTGATMWLDSCVSDGVNVVEFEEVSATLNIRNTNTYLKNIVGTINQY